MAAFPSQFRDAAAADGSWEAVGMALFETNWPDPGYVSVYAMGGREAVAARNAAAVHHRNPAYHLARPSQRPVGPSEEALPPLSAPEDGWRSITPWDTFHIAQNGIEAARRAAVSARIAADPTASGDARRRAQSSTTFLTGYARQADTIVAVSSDAWLTPLMTGRPAPAEPSQTFVPVKLRV